MKLQVFWCVLHSLFGAEFEASLVFVQHLDEEVPKRIAFSHFRFRLSVHPRLLNLAPSVVRVDVNVSSQVDKLPGFMIQQGIAKPNGDWSVVYLKDLVADKRLDS